MINIATVVFRDELPVLRLQAESVGLYCQDLQIHNIYVVVNDDESIVQMIDSSWWGPLRNKVLVIPRSAFSTEFVENGWVSQQALKIITAAMSYDLWTMVLDAKTIITKKLDWQELLDQKGRPRVGSLPLYEVFGPSKELAEKLFNIQITEQIGPGGVPFFFHNPTIRAMIAYIEAKSGVLFPAWFQLQGMLTEFVLYSAFVQFRDGSFDHLYSHDNAIVPVNICHSEVHRFDSLWKHASNATTVSVHRNAWSQLTEQQKDKFRHQLIDRNISGAWLIK